MPIREYVAVDPRKACDHCRSGFEQVELINQERCAECPECGNKVERQISAPRINSSESGFDDRAKNAGFQKLNRLGKGEYEQEY